VNDGPIAEVAQPRLFEPFTIRGLTIKNRLVVPPMVHYRAEAGATCGSFHLVHLGRYALGGFGLVFVEATGVEEIGLINEHDLGINRRFEDWSPEYGWWLEKRIRTMEGFATPTGMVTRRP
jgi:2,4-dienoyl-CoA reductase-like NADH-dependent reductase (Old Yellow Enzyme family)